MIGLLWLVPLLPFAGFVANGLLGPRVLPRKLVGPIACVAVALSFVVALGAVVGLGDLPESSGSAAGSATEGSGLTVDHEGHRVTQTLFTWMPLGPGKDGRTVSVDWSYVIDPLSAVMLLVVTGVGLLIHLYSIGYMEHEDRSGYARFFAYLNLFMGMMLVLVLGGSLPVLFVGWEGVGLCSYLLIGFWYDRMFDEKSGMSVADAGRKAFIVNRIGDTGFILGTLLLLSALGTVQIQEVLQGVPQLSAGMATAAALLLFVGVCGKSAQIPLYVWLPDAMAGPTPVSALIHAATMVTAGVYVLARMGGLYVASPLAMTVVAVTGGLTALWAATLGTAQTDIKKVLAYSTVSQLGYMVLAAGVGAFTAGVFHLMTHAFFKALLFLGAGSVIHALSGEQDILKMGGLRKHLPWTHATFLIGTLAIAGVPPLAGFFSKDEILLGAWERSHVLWIAGAITAGLTAFYMMRLYLLVFRGRERFDQERARRPHNSPHESPRVMTIPLFVLAGLSVVGGFVGLPEGMGLPNLFAAWLHPVLPAAGHAATTGAAAAPAGAGHGDAAGLIAVTLLITAAGLLLAWLLYAKRPDWPGRIAAQTGALRQAILSGYGVDALYQKAFVEPLRWLAAGAARFDRLVVDGIVNGTGWTTLGSSYTSRAFDLGVVDGLVNL
ncbi:MAG TPA: NADH-quinone oxidoreductase subunit L, partial [Tepidisphaeraceae bacterium]|nr:NADH-quinone oxidoreductase subunit L [Tepidisphaeraceae bacterium]